MYSSLGALIRNIDFTAHTIQLELNHAGTVFVHIAQTQVLDHQRLTFFNVHPVGLTHCQAMEVNMAAQTGNVTVFCTGLEEVFQDLRVDAPGNDITLRGLIAADGAQVLFHFLKVRRRQQCAGTAGDGLLALQYDLLQVFREAPCGLAHHALEVADDGVGIAQICALFHNVLGSQVVLHHEDRQVAHHLGGRGHLDQVAQHVVDLLVHLLNFQETVAQIETLHLGLQVGVLAARNLIAINVGHRSLQVGLELHVPFPNICPVIGQLLEIHHIQTGITLLAFQGGNHCVQRGLTGQGAHGGNCQVHNVHAGFGSQVATWLPVVLWVCR